MLMCGSLCDSPEWTGLTPAWPASSHCCTCRDQAKQTFKVTGYKIGHGPRSKRNNSPHLTTATKDGSQTEIEALHAYTPPERMDYLVRAVFYGRSNFANFWTKIWPSKQLKATNDTLDRQFSTYLRVRQSILLQTLFDFWEIACCPVNCTHLTTFLLFTANNIQKMASSGPALSIVQYVGN